jgi:hypothetical protein
MSFSLNYCEKFELFRKEILETIIFEFEFWERNCCNIEHSQKANGACFLFRELSKMYFVATPIPAAFFSSPVSSILLFYIFWGDFFLLTILTFIVHSNPFTTSAMLQYVFVTAIRFIFALLSASN